ncbi:plasmid mobilization protein [Kribbella catacumbae]|uniref:plasmid mobilization protein n=1 Tax=Kribbella catacumbae TaxID=460086 RepID=UPI00037B9601|nr:hypothetical protein [Kribbella catacumbae]
MSSQTSNDSASRRSRRRAPRPYDQAAQLTARMSPEDRDFIKEKAQARGLSLAAYLLVRAEEDQIEDRSVSAFGQSPSATVGEDNSTGTAEGPRRFGEAPHAKADLAAATAVG